ncbi:MAG: hypothetical protein AAGU15_08975 [Anaerolineaceae bacterium]|mgnify:CR=1 FL=1
MAAIKSLIGAGWLKDSDDNFQSLASLAGFHITKFTFDSAANDAGSTPASNKTVAAHPMAVTIPDNAIVIGGHVDVIAAVTSDGSATIAIHLVNANDLFSATSGAKANLTLAAQKPMATWTTPIKLEEEKAVTVTVGTAALTAGKLDGYILWMEGA